MRAAIFTFLLSCLFSSLIAQDISVAEIKNFSLEKMDGRELLISFKTRVENPSNKRIGVVIKKGLLYKDGECYGSFKMTKKIKLNKVKEEVITVPIKVTLQKDINAVEEGLQMLLGKQMEIKITGKLKATWFIFWKKYPFEHQEKLSMKSFRK